MAKSSLDSVIFTTKVLVPDTSKGGFVDWQAKLNASIAAFPGFISLEILSPTETPKSPWVIIERFSESTFLARWRHSKEYTELTAELKHLVGNLDSNIQESESGTGQMQGGITEVFVTQVSPGMESAYRKWIAKIHQVEAKFPGFRGVYVQAPAQGKGSNWITLLQFDNPENLERWLTSSQRAEVLQESNPLILSLDTHRVISPYAGWFSSLAKSGELPPTWKQTMIILLVLFPIVMLETKYLPLLTGGLNPSLAMFISNAISVTLLAWPCLPFAIRLLKRWLTPVKGQEMKATLLGTGLILALYCLEIFIFWHLLH